MKRFFRVRYLLVLIIALILASGVLGFAAQNTVPGSSAGDGAADISGYTVTNVHYILATDPTNINMVSFTLTGPAAAPSTVAARVTSLAVMSPCSASGTTWTCDVPDSSVLGADNLRVVAAQ